ncbi:glutaminyl-peptide cyclotransferase [Mangrovimonas sp. CR14]|nr:glutaminyl-peptide cyclotransferase [Mangrovimonas sp. CR14]
MEMFKSLTIIFLSALAISCGSSSAEKKKSLSVKTNSENHVFTIGNTMDFSLNNPKNYDLGEVTFSFDGKPVSSSVDLSNIRLGEHQLVAQVNLDGEPETIQQTITVMNDMAPKVYTFNIVNEYPHDITSYTQGLEFYKGELYESTGQYGESKLRKVDYKTGEVIQNYDLPKEYFAEGLTVMNDKVYQLTWKRGTGFVYDANSFEKLSSFKYNESKEGWGICNDGQVLYKSDGTEKIWTLNPETLMEESYVQAYHSKGKVVELNELEWVEGKIYSNRWQKNGVAIINPVNGAVEGVIDFTPLHNKVTQHPKLDVLNGIAYNPETKTLFVTGKRWDKLFEVEIVEK